jgi:hypothetical protein
MCRYQYTTSHVQVSVYNLPCAGIIVSPPLCSCQYITSHMQLSGIPCQRRPNCSNLEPARARLPELGQLGLALRIYGKELWFGSARILLELLGFIYFFFRPNRSRKE